VGCLREVTVEGERTHSSFRSTGGNKKWEKRAVDITMQGKSEVTVEIVKTLLLESISDKRLLTRLDDIFKRYRVS
jgi:hypothetical protein